MRSWLKKYGLCPCCLLAREIERAMNRRCLLCILCAFVFSGIDLKSACAADDDRKNDGALSGAVPTPMETVQIIPLPSTVAMRFFGIKGPQSIVIASINASEQNQEQLLRDNPYTRKRVPHVYKYAF